MRFLDTNILIRAITNDDPVKAQPSRALLYRVQAGLERLVTTESVIAEAVYVLSSPRQYHLPPVDIVTRLAPIIRLPGVTLPRKRVLLRALVLYQTYPRFDVEDALAVATMERQGVTEIVSYDTDFDGIPGIIRLEPGSMTNDTTPI